MKVDASGRMRSKSDGGGKGKMIRGAQKVMEMIGVYGGDYPKRSLRQAAEYLLHLIAKAHNNIVAGKYLPP